MVGEPTLTPGAGFAVELVDQVDDVEEAAAGAAADAGAGDAIRGRKIARNPEDSRSLRSEVGLRIGWAA